MVDPKMRAAPLLYLPANFAVPEAVEKLHADCGVRIQSLPKPLRHLGEMKADSVEPHGLLYLPNKYVVPGGRFNEMYGWDSYFIIIGLLRDGRTELARGMVENFFFEIEHYGGILNANRTYYLTRSQPPFLSSMVMAVHDSDKRAGRSDDEWMARAYDYISRDYDLWSHEPHLAGATGLSRYYDFGEGPPAEGLQDESGFYRKVVDYFATHGTDDYSYLVQQDKSPTTLGAAYTISVCDAATGKQACEPTHTVRLSDDYYTGDRSMRESGFDVSFRFGPFGAATQHYAPVCLNSLLYKTETDMAQIARMLHKEKESSSWEARAQTRKQNIGKYLWDEGQGMFLDYQFSDAKRSNYRYLTTFYPLWAGLATPEQARAVVGNLPTFEHEGGLAMSPVESGVQWDYPYGWAPVEMLAIEGLRRYGFDNDADRLTIKFLTTVLVNFELDGTIREKYNVVTGSSETPVAAGYQANVIGFGWTNGGFLELLHDLPPAKAEAIGKNSAIAH